MEWEKQKEILSDILSAPRGTHNAFSGVVNTRWCKAVAGWKENNQVSGHWKLPNKGQALVKFQSGAHSPISFLLIMENSIYHGTRTTWMEKRAVKRGRVDIFSHTAIFKRRSNSSNNISTSLPPGEMASMDASQFANVASPRSHK